MAIKETDIAYETADGAAWVLRDKRLNRYTVFRSGHIASKSDSSYPLDDDGLSIAKARADYLSRRTNQPPYSAPAQSR